jgi:hypothetical protein
MVSRERNECWRTDMRLSWLLVQVPDDRLKIGRLS